MRKIPKNEIGITLVSLVITIVVLLVLASISIGALWGENGVIKKAQEADFKTKVAQAIEQFDIYLDQKKMQNRKFQQGTLNAGETTLFYNTQKDDETGNIYTVLSGIEKDFVKNFEIIKGELFYFTQNEKEKQWALELGLTTNPYEIIDGVLTSNDKNLILLDERTGTLTIPERVKEVGEGTFSNLNGIKKIIIPSTCKIINNNAFNGNRTLEEVLILADGDIGLQSIGNYAFKDCPKLKKISMPNTVNNLGIGVFWNCSSLVNVQLSNKIPVLLSQVFSRLYFFKRN